MNHRKASNYIDTSNSSNLDYFKQQIEKSSNKQQTATSIVQSLLKQEKYELLLQVHGMFQIFGINQESSILEALFVSLSRLGYTDRVLQLWNDNRKTIKPLIAIDVFLFLGMANVAWNIVASLERPIDRTLQYQIYSKFIEYTQNDIKAMENAISRLKKAAIMARRDAFSKIIHVYSRHGNMQKAKEWLAMYTAFNPGINRLYVPMSTVLAGYARLGDVIKVTKLLDCMLSLGMQIDPRLWSSIIHAFVESNDIKQVKKCLDIMSQQNLDLDPHILLSLLSLYSRLGQTKQMEVLYKKILSLEDHALSMSTVLDLCMSGYSIAGETAKLESFTRDLVDRGYSITPRMYFRMVEGYVKVKNIKVASDYFSRMMASLQGDGLVELRKHEDVRWLLMAGNRIIKGLLSTGNIEIALDNAEKMAAFLHVDAPFLPLLQYYSERGAVEDVMKVMKTAEVYGIFRNPVAVNLVVKAFSRAKRFSDVLAIGSKLLGFPISSGKCSHEANEIIRKLPTDMKGSRSFHDNLLTDVLWVSRLLGRFDIFEDIWAFALKKKLHIASSALSTYIKGLCFRKQFERAEALVRDPKDLPIDIPSIACFVAYMKLYGGRKMYDRAISLVDEEYSHHKAKIMEEYEKVRRKKA